MIKYLFNNHEYLAEEVLIPNFILLNSKNTGLFYHYFKNLDKPPLIHSIIGIIIELPIDQSIEYFIEKDYENIIKILQFDLNKPLLIGDDQYFFTLFNIPEEEIITFLLDYLLKFKKHRPYIGISINHPLTLTNEFVNNTILQLQNSKKKNCFLSALNSSTIKL